MFVAVLLSLAQSDAVNNGGVIELVGDDGVVGSQEHLEKSSISVKTTRIEDGVFSSVKLGNLFLQHLQKKKRETPNDVNGLDTLLLRWFIYLVDVLGATNEAYATQASSVLVKGLFLYSIEATISSCCQNLLHAP